MENSDAVNEGGIKRPGSKRIASCSPPGSAFSPRNSNQTRRSARNNESGEDYPKSSSPLRSPLSPSKQNGNRRSTREPTNAWSKPLVIRDDATEVGSRAASRRSLNMGSSSASPARPLVEDEVVKAGGAASSSTPTSRRSISRAAAKLSGSDDGPSSISSVSSFSAKRAGSPDSGLHSSPAPSSVSHSNRSSEERHASSSRSRTHSGSSSSCMETVSTMNESKDWSSIVEDKELLECELSEHADRVREKLAVRGDAPLPSKQEILDTLETDLDVIARRKKQLSYGKNTKAYAKYLEMVPKKCRIKGIHPMTPDKYKKLSRRSFDSLVKRWKRDIATWDPSETGRSQSSASSLNSSLEVKTSEASPSLNMRSRDTSKKRPFDEDVATSSSSAAFTVDETSQDSCASTAELMSEASLASPVKRSYIRKESASEEATVGSEDLRHRLRLRLSEQS